MMRIISVVGLNSGQDEDVQGQQVEGVGSGRAQARGKNMWKTHVRVNSTCAQVGRCSRGRLKSRGRGAKRNQAQAGFRIVGEMIKPSRWSGHFPVAR